MGRVVHTRKQKSCNKITKVIDFEPRAREFLREAMKLHLNRLLETACLCARLSNRSELLPKDIQLARRMLEK